MKKINFQDLPSTDTPIKASTLNTMQSNIEESCVAVSPTQPETNERIWIQKGKNLFNINNYNLFNGWLNVDTKNFDSNNNGYLVYIPCEPNTTYVASRKFLERNFRFGSGNIVPVNGGIATQVIEAKDLTEVSLTTGTNDRYLYVYIHYEGDSSYSFEEIISSLCIEEASSATPKKIWCKNDNGVFEEFYNESEMNKTNYSTNEQVIGTWIDGRPLYRKVIVNKSLTVNTGDENRITQPHNIANINEITYIYNRIKTSWGAGWGGPDFMGKAHFSARVDETNIYFENNSGSNWTVDYLTILHYTKTTD